MINKNENDDDDEEEKINCLFAVSFLSPLLSAKQNENGINCLPQTLHLG